MKMFKRLITIFFLTSAAAWGHAQPPSAYPAQIIKRTAADRSAQAGLWHKVRDKRCCVLGPFRCILPAVGLLWETKAETDTLGVHQPSRLELLPLTMMRRGQMASPAIKIANLTAFPSLPFARPSGRHPCRPARGRERSES